MSNIVVGNVYAQIIDRIIDAARNDFEEAAVDGTVLQELKEQWQKNLSSLNVAHCPWDPAPSQPQLANPPTLPSNVTKAEASPAPGSGPSQLPSSQHGGVRIKQEIKYENGSQSHPPMNGYASIGQGINPLAAQRAQSLVAQQYGQAASAAIQPPQVSQQPQSRPLTLPGQQQQRPNHVQLPNPPHQRAPQQQQYPQQHSNLGAAQTDGSSDAPSSWDANGALKQGASDKGRLDADNTFRAQLSQHVYAVDTGIFAPLSQQLRQKRHAFPAVAQGGGVESGAKNAQTARISQLDGIDDEDDKTIIKRDADDDEDAINSDLDDDDELDGQPEDDGDGPVGETILCTYDKVQRVKNKWKCTLKDGILTTGSREYVFHKANGEFEW